MSVIITIRCYRVCVGDAGIAGTVLLLIDIYTDSYNNSCTIVHVRRSLFSERELVFTFAICHRLSVTFVHPTLAIEIFGKVFMPFSTLDIC